MNETIESFGPDAALVGIITHPLAGQGGTRPGFVLVNSGMVHRAGPNRLYVKLARQLAAAGYPVLRFDLSGIGDSAARSDTAGFEQRVIDEAREAMRALGQRTGVQRFVMAGICSGADISFLTTCSCQEVVGAVLINGRSLHGVTDDAGDELAEQLNQAAKAQYLWKRALFNPRSWRRLLGTDVAWRENLVLVGRQCAGVLRKLGHRHPAGPGLQARFNAVLGRGARLLLVFSDRDPAINYTRLMLGRSLAGMMRRHDLQRVHLPGADHTFTGLTSQTALINCIADWADHQWGRAAVQPSPMPGPGVGALAALHHRDVAWTGLNREA